MKKSKLFILLAFFSLTISGCNFSTTVRGGSVNSSSESSEDSSNTSGDEGENQDNYTYSVELTNASELTSLVEGDSLTLTVKVDKKEDGLSLSGYPYYPSASEVTVLGYDNSIINVSSLTVTALKEGSTSLYIQYLEESSPSYPVSVFSNTSIETNAYYSLVGDFYDNEGGDWNGWPSQDSIYYLGYDTTNPSSMYWERTVTMSSSSKTWNASLYVAYVYYDELTSEDIWQLVVGYEHLDSNSTGVLGASSDGGIQVSWGETYDLVIDMRGVTPSILVTLHVDSGDDDNPGSETPTEYDANYSLYGDFIGDDNWNDNPNSDLDSYLGYSSIDPSSKVWERTMTVTSEPDFGMWSPWDACFRIIVPGDYEDDDTRELVGGYSLLDYSASTGVENWSDDDDNIKLTHWNAIYDIYIDLSGTTGRIVVTYISDVETGGDTGEKDVELTDYYALSGDFLDNSWGMPSSINDELALPYNSGVNNSKYWQRTITTCAKIENQDYPGFRVIDTSWEYVAGYTNLTVDSSSTGIMLGYYDGDNNLKLDNWNTTYDITIDMRASSWTIIVNYHQDGFDGTVNGLYDGSSSATDPEIEVDDDFIMGADISSIIEVENGGGKFYDTNGNENDLISILADNGINYARIRLWNDPYSTSSVSYQGGGNDITRDIQIASRCVQAGMKICLDLHYSDFWAHHGQQYTPKAWVGLSGSTLFDTAASWTSEVLQKFSQAGISIDMIQIGNETNNNQICGLSDSEAETFFTRCAASAKSFNPNIKVVIHYAMDQYASTYESKYNALINAGCNFDVLGLSFYPYYHTNETLDYVLSYLNTRFSSKNKEICIMEYSYGWTTSWKDWNTGYGQMRNTFNDSLATTAGYEASVEGQAKCIYDINQSIASITLGIGAFYWEPGWLSVLGSSWASVASNEYYLSNGNSSYDASEYGDFDVTTWSNQALFDYDGKALDSLKVYNFMKGL